jgi:hypothetical protein
MGKRIRVAVVAAAVIGGTTFGQAGAASAAHCVAPVGESATPGFSYFGNDHNQEAHSAEGGNPGPHAGTSGASNCRATTGSPSERAPGRM